MRSPFPCSLVVASAVLCGCNLALTGSNFVDGGGCLVISAEEGSATLTGAGSFAVASAGEYLSVPTNGYGGTGVLGFSLSSGPEACGLDAGPAPLDAGASVFGNLFNQGPGPFGPGDFTIVSSVDLLFPSVPITPPPWVDGGYASFGMWVVTLLPDGGFSLDGGLALTQANSGTIHLASIQDCSISGSFSASFSPDGGAPLNGTFQAVYCP